MTTAGALKLTTPGERELVMTRSFDAPRRLVFDAHTKPELVRRWVLGPPGWSMPVCEIDLRVGGKFRYVWQHDRDGTKMGMGGMYREIKAPERIVNTEEFDEAWYPGEALGTLVLVEQGGKTTLTYTMRYESRAARDARSEERRVGKECRSRRSSCQAAKSRGQYWQSWLTTERRTHV